MSPEAQTAVKTLEASVDANDAKKIALEFATQNKYSGLDKEIEFEEEGSKITIDYRRSFNNQHVKYIFEDGQLSKMVFVVDPIPGTLLSHKIKISLTPAEAGVTAAMVLSLVRSIKKDERTFQKKV